MSELSVTQAWLAARLMSLRPAEDAAEAAAYLAAGPRLSPLQQLEIYREQFWLRHTASLLEDFPGLSRALGAERWQRLIEGYLAAHPPTSPSLRDLGQGLVPFLAAEPDCEPAWLDLARLEWAYLECFDAADSRPLDRTALASWSEEDWDGARLALSPSLRLLTLGYPVAELRRALLTGDDPPPSAALPPQPTFLAVYRGSDGGLWDKPLTEPAFRLLELLAEGTPLGLACERVVLEATESPAAWEGELGSWFADFSRLGWVVEVSSG